MDVDGDQTKPTHKTVFFGGIHPKVTKAMLQSFCESEFGPVENVQLIWDYNTGQSKGYGFVHFANVEDALAVKSLGTVRFFGREMNVGDAMLSNRRNKLCKYYFETGRCSKPNCGFAHSLAALQGNVQQLASQGNTTNFTQNMAEYLDPATGQNTLDLDPAYLEQALTALGGATGGNVLADLGGENPANYRQQVYAGEESFAQQHGRYDMAGQRRGWPGAGWTEPDPQMAAPVVPPTTAGAEETLQPRLQLINNTYCLIVPLQTVVQNPTLLPLLSICTGQGTGAGVSPPAPPAANRPQFFGSPPAPGFTQQQPARQQQQRKPSRPKPEQTFAVNPVDEYEYFNPAEEAQFMDAPALSALEDEGFQQIQQQLRNMMAGSE
eukprot:TRINITY_DN2781_c0_g1_i1.p1 TRINITY_DN2781_c0_g1~~TRINITY_DN2781_c0_g1_i1.p1  ORF type:complete len:393 (+),score=57.92 TRINITY_DN2781_c0_g1_i1:40-1179(+)